MNAAPFLCKASVTWHVILGWSGVVARPSPPQNAWASLSNSLSAKDFVEQLDLVVKQAEQSLNNLEREAQTKGVPIENDPVAKALQNELNSFLNTYKGVGQSSTLKSIDEMSEEEIDAELNG